MSLSASEFVRAIAENRVLDAGHLDDLQPLLHQFKDTDTFAQHLISLGWLTPYQVECVLTGHAPSLLFGDYRLLQPLGQGGMGQVFKAAHLRLNRLVAIKMINPKSLHTAEKPEELIRRFQREAQAAAQLIHPNIVILFDYNEMGGVHFIAMEYVDGVDLAKMVQSQGPLPIQLACDFICQTASGLQHANEYGMVHRDIKPQNLLVTRGGGASTKQRNLGSKSGVILRPEGGKTSIGGVIKILDLGLVRMSESIDDTDTLSALTMQGTIIGTPDYIAPEQARDASGVDIRADLYSLGCTFYFLLAGRPPFPGGTSVEKLFRHQNEQPMALESIRPNMPKEVIGIVQRLMAKRADSRFQTPAELIEAIRALSGESHVGRTKSEVATMVAAAAETSQSERTPQISVPTQMFSPDSFILPAKKVAVLQGHKGFVTALDFSTDGRWLASGSIDGTVRLWDVGMAKLTERPLDQANGLGEIGQLTFGGGGKHLFAGTAGLDTRIWRWDFGAANQNVRSRFNPEGYLTCCYHASPDGNYFAAGSAAAVLTYDLKTGKKPTVFKGHYGEVRALVYAQNSKRLYSAGEDKRIVMWEPARYWGNQRAVFQGHSDSITHLTLSPDGSLLASCSVDGSIRLWDSSGESTESVAVLTGHNNGVRIVRFVGSGNLMLSVGDGGQVCLWEVTEASKVREWQIEKVMTHAFAISPDGRYVATGIGSGTVNYYDLDLLVGAEAVQQLQYAG